MQNKDKISIHFLGAAGTVTGSKYLIDTGERKIMIDCDLFHGLKKLRLLNWDYLPVLLIQLSSKSLSFLKVKIEFNYAGLYHFKNFVSIIKVVKLL